MTAAGTTREDPARSVAAVGRVNGVTGPLVLATGAVHDARRAGAGFLSTWGHYGVQAHFYAPTVTGERRTLMTQLHATFAGLHHLYGLYCELPHDQPIEIRLGHEGALTFLQDWARGGTGMPEGYRVWRINDAVSPLERLRETVAGHAQVLTFRHEGADPRHVLQQAARSLATLGLRTSKGLISADALPGIARQYARGDLVAHHRLGPHTRPRQQAGYANAGQPGGLTHQLTDAFTTRW